MNRIYKILLSLFLVALSGMAMGQQDKPLRVEFECDPGVEPYVAVPCGIYGVLAIYPTMEEVDNALIWEFLLMDVNFKPVWRRNFNIGEELKFRHDAQNENILYLAFSKSGKIKDEINLQVLRIDLTTADIKEMKTTIAGRPQKSAMEISRNIVVIGVERSKGNANLLYLDFNTMVQSQLPFELSKDHKLLSIDYDNDNNRFCFISSFEPHQQTQSVDYFFWEPLSTTFIAESISGFKDRQVVNSARLISQGDSMALIIGGYNDTYNSVRNYADEYGTPYSGLFSYHILNDSLKILPLNEFDDIYSIISANDISTTRKQRKKDKTPDIKLYLSFHEPEIHNNEIILLTESYYPQFHTVSTMAYDYYGRPLTTYYDVFDGFRYSKAIVCSFDREGNIVWTNHMDIRDVIVDRNKNIAALVKDDEYYLLAYAGIGKVASQVINKDEIIDDITVAGVDFLYSRDRLMDTGTSTITHWYGQYFLVSGYQTIRNSRVTKSGKRTVFYMNKMAYR